ncbi:MAG: hypothetical protein ABIC95_04655 [archaeon]
MGEYWENVKRHVKFGRKETFQILLASILMGVMFSFDDGREKFSMAYWIGNFLLFFAIVLVSMLFRVLVQKMVATKTGYRVEFKVWNFGLAIGIMLTVLTNGKLILLIPGGIAFYHLAADRLGHFRYGLNYSTCGWIASVGSIANIVLGMFFKEIMKQSGLASGLLDRFIYVNFLLALFLFLPLPPLDGLMMFFGTRLGYMFIFGGIFGYVALYLAQVYSLILAVIIAVVTWGAFFILFEREAGL